MAENQILEKPGYWAVIPADIRYDEVIPPNAKLLYAEISALTGANGYCFAGNDYFMKVFGFSTRTVSRLISSLEERGYIRIEDGGNQQRKIFAGVNPLSAVRLDKNVQADVQDASETCPALPKLAGGLDKIVYHNNKYNNIPPKAPQGAASVCDWKAERFEGLWEFYPHDYRGHRSRAVKAWNRLQLDDGEIDKLARGLQIDMASDDWQRGIGIPHLSTYLNGSYWQDALDRVPEPEEEAGGRWVLAPEESRG